MSRGVNGILLFVYPIHIIFDKTDTDRIRFPKLIEYGYGYFIRYLNI